MGRKKKEGSLSVSNIYFGEVEEQGVIDYINSNNREEKNKIYETCLKSPFKKMIESIIRRYPIHLGNYDITEVEGKALSHLIENMIKFNPERIGKSGLKAKAYSYCQTIVRNYYKDHSKKTYAEKKTHLNFDEYKDDLEEREDFMYEMDEPTDDYVDTLIQKTIDQIQNTIDNDCELKKNEIIVGKAIIVILNNWHILFQEESIEGNYNKKITNKFIKNKMLLYLKEQTGLTTKDIRSCLKPFKELYFLEKADHDNE